MISHQHDYIIATGQNVWEYLCLSVWKNELYLYLVPRLVTPYLYTVNCINYTPNYFINFSKYQTKLLLMSHISHAVLNSFWTIYISLIINDIIKYASSVLCKINFWLICLPPKWNVSCKKLATKSCHQKIRENLKPLYFCQEMNIQLTE